MVAREGWPFIIAPLGGAALGLALGAPLLAAGAVLLSGAMAFFFRDPERHPPADPRAVVAPADGRVVRVERTPEGTSISIFLSILDVHINRAPVGGRVVARRHTPGRFVIATRDEASAVNERNELVIDDGSRLITCRQIAGVVARRIVCWKQVGDPVARGERIGLIRFGSRTDLLLPSEVEVTVAVGDRVRGGETVVGRMP